jgi:hypothetical protein
MAYTNKDTAIRNLKEKTKKWDNPMFDNFRGDKDVVKEASKVCEYEGVLKFASNDLKKDAEFILSLDSKIFNYDVPHIDKTLTDNKDFVIELIRKGALLNNFSEKLRDDKDVVMVAVSEQPELRFMPNLQYASYRLQDDKEVVISSIKNIPNSFQYVSDELKFEREILKFALQLHGDNLEYTFRGAKRDKELVLIAVSQNASSLCYVPDDCILKNDKDVAVAALTQNNSRNTWVRLGNDIKKEMLECNNGKEPEDYLKALNTIIIKNKLTESLKVNQSIQPKKLKL